MKHAILFLLAIMMATVNTWAQCPTITTANIAKSTDVGVCTAVVTYSPNITPLTAVVTYNFTGATTGNGSGTGSGSTFNKGITTIKLTIVANGCTIIKTFKVTVSDHEAPTITCPGSYSYFADPGQCSALFQYVAPTVANGKVTDNCSPAPTVVRISGPASGTTLPVGTTMVRYRATDGAGNISICSFTVTVVDDQLPTVTCPANITVNQSQGCAGGTATFPNPTGTDECGISFTWLTSGLASGSCFPIGVSTNTWKTTDSNGNAATCTHTITVIEGPTPNATGAADRSGTETAEENFQVYPNPSTGAVTIITENGASIYTATGQLISTWKEISKEITGLMPGFYIVKTNKGAKTFVVTQ